MDSGAPIEAMRAAARALTCGSDLDAVRAIQAAQDALDSAKGDRLASIEQTRAYELDGASSLKVWVRNELRVSAKQAATLVKGPSTCATLPAVGEAAAAGLIRTEHVAAFTFGLKHIGADTIITSEPWLLDVALTCEPNELFKVVRALRDAVFPDELDKAWADGMDKQDIQVTPVPGGWHVTGFLTTAIGAKFKAVLDSVAKPVDADDARTGSERRVDGFDTVLTTILESGLPSDNGVRPHLSVIVDADTLDAALNHREGSTSDPGAPAQLVGFGSIGPQLLGYLACGTDITAILMRGNTHVLDVGRSHRLATLKQRRAIIARQGGVCATPGCHNTHLEIHHTTWWSNGGTTNLDHLIGICTRCHHLVHRKLLTITSTGRGQFNFTNHDNRPLIHAQHTRITHHREAWKIHKTTLAVTARQRQRVISRT